MAENDHALDETDRRILNRVQPDFPIASRPYRVIADELGLSEQEVIERLRGLKASGIIRLIGGKPSKAAKPWRTR